MASAYVLMVVILLLKYIMENDVFFSGKVIVLGGDLGKFNQICPTWL
jgi:hypothetical protein